MVSHFPITILSILSCRARLSGFLPVHTIPSLHTIGWPNYDTNMLFKYILYTFLSASSAVASLALGTFNDGVQQVPIGDELDERETLTFTFTTTRTRLEFESHTKTRTREYVATATVEPTAKAQPTPAMRNFPLAAKMLQAKERQNTCDETACAVCMWYFQCGRGTPEWYVIMSGHL